MVYDVNPGFNGCGRWNKPVVTASLLCSDTAFSRLTLKGVLFTGTTRSKE